MQPNCPIHLHDLLVRLLELEDEARKELTQQAYSVAVARVLERGKLSSGNKLSKKQRTFLKAVQKGRRRINEVYRNDQALWFAYQLQLSQAENDLAAPLVRDSKVVVKGKLRTRLTPLNLALRELVIAGIGIDERQIHEYLVELNPIWGRGPDPSIARIIADLHEKDVTNTILRRLRREHPQIFKSEPFLRCGWRAGEMARTLQDTDKPRRREHSDRPVAQSRPDNRLVELLVKLELEKLRRECMVTTTAARRLLDDSKFRSEILRARFSDPKTALRKDLTFSVSERRELRDFAGGEVGFPDFSVGDKVHAAMVLATGEVGKEELQRKGEDYVERGGSLIDWHRHGDHPLDKYVLNRIEAKLSEIIEEPHGALHVFIIRTIEGRAAKHEDIRWALDRLVRDGFADELLRDVWGRYPIEARILRLASPSEAQPVESAAREPPSKTTDSRGIRLGVRIQNILVAQEQGSSCDDSSREPKVQTAASERTREEHVPSMATPASAKLDDDAWLTHKDIAQRLGLNDEMVRKRVDRFRVKNHDCFREVSDREPGHLYHVKAIRLVIDALITSGEIIFAPRIAWFQAFFSPNARPANVR